MALLIAISSAVIILPVLGSIIPAGAVCVCVAMVVTGGCAEIGSDSASVANSCSPDRGASYMMICSGPSTSLVSLAVDGAGVLDCVVRSSSLTLSNALTSSAVSSLMYISHPRSDSAGLKSSH